MLHIPVRYYSGNTSSTGEAELLLTRDGRLVLIYDGESQSYQLNDVNFSSRLGNTPRVLNLPDGGKCHIHDNDAIDDFLQQQKTGRAASVIHKLESRFIYVLTALLLTVILSWAMISYGIPALAKEIAYHLPENVVLAISKGTLKTLDRVVFQPSQLDKITRTRLEKRFAEMKSHIPDSSHYRLVFRSSKQTGANAFALPSGIIVMTDDMVKISKNDNEIVAVLAHELGHLIHRHAIRMAMQNSALALLIAGITGDPVSTSSLIAAMPTVLIHSKYSREFETEADDYAYHYMVSNHIDTQAFADILKRISGSEKESGLESYLSSHPGTAERILRFEHKHSSQP